MSGFLHLKCVVLTHPRARASGAAPSVRHYVLSAWLTLVFPALPMPVSFLPLPYLLAHVFCVALASAVL